MSSLSRVELVGILNKKLGLKVKVAESCIDKLFIEICNALANGENVKLAGFGTLYTTARKSRIGRNPTTKEVAVISARNVVSFRCSENIKNSLNGGRRA